MATSQNQVPEDANINGLDLPEQSGDEKQSSSNTVVNGANPSSSSPTKPNPLGNLSSYTYGLSLYMVNPGMLNKFIKSGGTMAGIANSPRGVRVVAQSGGISQNEKSLKSLDGTQIEYYIDDLTFTTLMPGGPQKAAPSTLFKFKIIEPYGFAFLQDITRAGFELNEEGGIDAPKMNGLQQHFILGIKFYGYDVDGKVITQVPSNTKGSNPGGQFPERHFAIILKDVKFKLDGRMVTYNCEGTIASEQAANGQINGILKSSTTLIGSNIWEVLANPTNNNSLVSVLNSSTESYKDRNQVKFPTKYAIEFLDGAGKVVDKDSVIAKAKLVNDATFDNSLASTLNISSSEKSTIAQQFKAVSIDGSKVSLPQSYGQNLLSIIDNIITKSEYISAALKQITTASAETVAKDQTTKTLEWYSVNPVISVVDFDPITNDWAYEIKFQIMPYSVPYVRTVNATRVSTYPGPSKRYDYWLTGENTEIISYEQQYNRLFYIATPANSTIQPDTPQNNGSVAVHPQNAQAASSSGAVNKQFEYNRELVAQMYSPADQSKIKIKIMGDPDYIMTSTGVDHAQSLGQDRAGIDLLKGQIFIEIKFLMATDYGDNGLLNISDKIQFYNQNSKILKDLKIDGVPYKVISVDSSFAKGTFTQTLSCVIVDQDTLSMPANGGAATSGKSAGPSADSNQRSETAAETSRLATKYSAPVENQYAAETARLSRKNADLASRPPVAPRTAQSSYARGIQSLVNTKPVATGGLRVKNDGQFVNGDSPPNDDQKLTPDIKGTRGGQ